MSARDWLAHDRAGRLLCGLAGLVAVLLLALSAHGMFTGGGLIGPAAAYEVERTPAWSGPGPSAIPAALTSRDADDARPVQPGYDANCCPFHLIGPQQGSLSFPAATRATRRLVPTTASDDPPPPRIARPPSV